jgi:CheY-like chemotaxis protein
MHLTTPWNILVGDDEANVREAMADLLRVLGHQVHMTHDGRSTVRAFAQGTYDLVFTDLGMPDISGWEVAQQIHDLNPSVPIVLATGWGATIDENYSDRGVSRVLSKPFTVQKLASLIAELQNARKAA